MPRKNYLKDDLFNQNIYESDDEEKTIEKKSIEEILSKVFKRVNFFLRLQKYFTLDEDVVHIYDNKANTSSIKIEKNYRKDCELIDESKLGNYKGTNVHVIYGNTPENIRKQVFLL